MPGLTGWLLLGLIALPLVGALAARLLSPRTGPRAARIAAAAGFAGALLCVAALQRAPQDAAALGRLRIFLPSRDVVIASDAVVELPTAAPTPAAETATPRPTATLAPTATDEPSPTGEPTATPTSEPTATPTSEPTATPTEAPPPPTEAPAPTEAPPPPTEPPSTQPRRYVVESGDTLRSIAERFGVSVDALLRYNGLSPEEGDSLSVGQELFIPPQ